MGPWGGAGGIREGLVARALDRGTCVGSVRERQGSSASPRAAPIEDAPARLWAAHDLSPDSFNILGQKDFFSLFPVKFTYKKREIHLMSASIDEQLH